MKIKIPVPTTERKPTIKEATVKQVTEMVLLRVEKKRETVTAVFWDLQDAYKKQGEELYQGGK